jgi:nicotinate-nucleotide pyrophosphorylase (carboxylating)
MHQVIHIPELDKHQLEDFIIKGLYEDIHEGDHTSQACIPADDRSTARLLVKGDGVLAGVEVAKAIFKHVDPASTIDVRINDGEEVKYGDVAFYVECNSQALLKAERLVLNTMQRLSGIATLSSRFAFEVEGLPVKILDTRKTTPLLRFLEKWAVKVGGCDNYRVGLYDWIMIKDNHVDACGSHSEAIDKVHEYLKNHKLDLNITVEVRNLVELQEVLDKGGITRIMFDNFELPILAEAVAHVSGRFETEASGGVTLHTVRKIAMTGVDYISVGALTHSVGTMDLSLKVIRD